MQRSFVGDAISSSTPFHRPKVSSKQVVFPRFQSVGGKRKKRIKSTHGDEGWSGTSASSERENHVRI